MSVWAGTRLCAAVIAFLSSVLLLLPQATFAAPTSRPPTVEADILVVGAGIAGLSTALQAARDGAHVTVLDMASVFGGHAVMSGGDISIVDTPVQRAQGIADSPDTAFRDFMTWGEDADAGWVRYYVDHSRTEIHDWLDSLGVKFEGVRPYDGNSVPRAHITAGRGIGLVTPLYRACLAQPGISFVWSFQATRLIVERGRVVGIEGRELRTGQMHTHRARAVVLATGGFQSNLDLVRKNWARGLPVPKRLLAGSGVNSQGSGLAMAAKAGAALFHLDHQWNYERGLPDPRYPGMQRGLNAYVDGVQVNALGVEFMPADATSKTVLPTLLRQPGGTYWRIFDEKAKHTFWVSGSDWADFKVIDRLILGNEAIVRKAGSIEELAVKTGLPAAALRETVARSTLDSGKIDTPPFYAAQFFPLARKSMGGIAVDHEARVVDGKGLPVPGLYAAGEAAGEAGINGKAALEGTFLGPGVITGRMAGRTATRDLGIPARSPAAEMSIRNDPPPTPAGLHGDSAGCTGCHVLQALVETPREGYWHFERAHRRVIEDRLDCAQCHAEIKLPFQPATHLTDRMAQSQVCRACHQGD